MKSIYGIAAVPIVCGVLGACADAHPPPGGDATLPPDEALAPQTPPHGAQPDFGPVVHQSIPPPPISGGTLALSPDRKTLVASDPDRDRVYIVDLPSRTLVHTVALPSRSEAGRVAVDDSGHAYVVLRRAGGIATVDMNSATVSTRRICIAPRGIAWDGARSALYVTCADGELVTMPSSGLGPLARRPASRDLRDVFVDSTGAVIVSTFRVARTFEITAGLDQGADLGDGSTLAWRTLGVSLDGKTSTLAMVSQHPTSEPVATVPGGYGVGGSKSSPCQSTRGIVTTRVRVGSGFVDIGEAVLPVDMATNGRELAVVAAGNAFTKDLPQLFILLANEVSTAKGGCVSMGHGKVPGQAVAAVFDASDDLVVQTREPAAIHFMTKDRVAVESTISLSSDSVADTGHAIFHANAGAFIACASCHAEGGDDGHVWTFIDEGPRRTPVLLGTVAGTEPFHWNGDMKDIRDLVDHVFVERMSGPVVDDQHLGALSGWLYALPPLPQLVAESDSTKRGAMTFGSKCSSCHSGPKLTNNQTIDVGTGGKFQVPSLIGVGWRTSLIHDGCAGTLLERFRPGCGGGAAHGGTTDLSEDQISDLVDFLGTL
jgi:mono/diheme cytochrome c family protein